MYICIYMCVCVCVYIYIYIYIYMYIRKCIYLYMLFPLICVYIYLLHASHINAQFNILGGIYRLDFYIIHGISMLFSFIGTYMAFVWESCYRSDIPCSFPLGIQFIRPRCVNIQLGFASVSIAHLG